jgi:UDP-GlcNAc:undecaprenyl-phosphate GlcNAc-1-phosphate transferase
MIPSFLYPFFLACGITLILTPLLIPVIRKFGLIDDPSIHKHPKVIHTSIVPRGGGIPLFLGVLLTSLFFLPYSLQTLCLFLGCFLALLVGIIDDKLNGQGKDLPPIVRLATNVLCASIIVFGGTAITYTTNPFGGIIHLNTPFLQFLPVTLGQLISIFWMIWVMNMMNWSKGVDQMPGIVAITAFVIGLLSLRFAAESVHVLDVPLSMIVAGVALGFLPYNLDPPKIFPGYGATALYLFLASVSILSTTKVATTLLVLGVPTVDAVFTIVRRIAHKQSPLLGDRKHLYHLLLDLGYSKRQIALFYWVLSAILGIVALTLESKSKFFALIMVTVITLGGLFFLHSIRDEKDS